MRSRVLAGMCAVVLVGLAGCGGDDGGGDDKGSADSKTTSTPAAASPSHAAVLKCLKDAGLEAEDQSSTNKTIGIDYPAGRLVISFQGSPEEAETYGSVAKTNGEGTIIKGKVVATIPVDAKAQSAEDTVEGCL